MSLWRRVIQHLLPRGRAWDAFAGSFLDRFLTGLADLPATIRGELDRLLYDFLPEETRNLPEWEEQFGLRARSLGEAERRQRVRGAWSATGGQSKHYIESVLRESGYDVRVHEWFLPRSEISGVVSVSSGALALDDGTVLEASIANPDFPAREPSTTIAGATALTRCGNPQSRCGVAAPDGREVRILVIEGGAWAFDDGTIYSSTGYYGARCSFSFVDGYMLVNRGLDDPDYPDPPTNEDDWAYVLYISSEEIGVPAQVPAERQDDLEALLLELCPAQQWIGMIVEYT